MTLLELYLVVAVVLEALCFLGFYFNQRHLNKKYEKLLAQRQYEINHINDYLIELSAFFTKADADETIPAKKEYDFYN